MRYAGLKVRTFKRGGVHPEEFKYFSEDKAIDNFPIPQKVVIPLLQHLGKPAKPLVKKGDIVKEGDLIGEKDGPISANIHSSVPGKVVDVKKVAVANNNRVPAVIIKTEGEFNKGNEEKQEWENLSKEDILEIIKNAGIVGMGGATFPTDIKLNPPADKKIDSLIINGVECEPFLTTDYRLMLEKSEEIIEGIKILNKLVDAENIYIGIELNKKEAIKKLKKLSEKEKKIKVVPLKVKYPQGGEKQLINAILKKEVPGGALPFEVGAIVSNVATVYAIREAVLYNKPLIERVVTVTGPIVKKPGNYKIKIGTLVKDVLDEVGIEGEISKLIIGGPMMGFAVNSDEIPVTKGTSGIVVFGEKEEKRVRYNDFESCIKCSKCLMACPISLNPSMLSILGEYNKWDEMKEWNLMDCIECGSCSFVCPANRPIVQFIKMGKFYARSKKN